MNEGAAVVRRLLAFVTVGFLVGAPFGALACVLFCASQEAPTAHHACERTDTTSPRLSAQDACGNHDDAREPSIAGASVTSGVTAGPALATVPPALVDRPLPGVTPAARGADPPGARRSPLLRL